VADRTVAVVTAAATAEANMAVLKARRDVFMVFSLLMVAAFVCRDPEMPHLA
jgi:hypothetical protein